MIENACVNKFLILNSFFNLIINNFLIFINFFHKILYLLLIIIYKKEKFFNINKFN